MNHKPKFKDFTICRNLKRLLAEKNLNQRDVARVCDRERKAVNHWINGYHDIPASCLKQICLEYRVSADEILGIKKWSSGNGI